MFFDVERNVLAEKGLTALWSNVARLAKGKHSQAAVKAVYAEENILGLYILLYQRAPNPEMSRLNGYQFHQELPLPDLGQTQKVYIAEILPFYWPPNPMVEHPTRDFRYFVETTFLPGKKVNLDSITGDFFYDSSNVHGSSVFGAGWPEGGQGMDISDICHRLTVQLMNNPVLDSPIGLKAVSAVKFKLSGVQENNQLSVEINEGILYPKQMKIKDLEFMGETLNRFADFLSALKSAPPTL